MNKKLKAPFPYFGGKGRWVEIIWQKFGTPDVYLEPFAGSLAVLLASPVKPKREIVCDTDHMIVNFWRAVAHDPETVAHHADWPTFHDDLTARHRWLIKWKEENGERFRNDPDFHDPKVAGWWVWGMSNWIGGGFCTDFRRNSNKIPHSMKKAGVNASQIPKISIGMGGPTATGIQAGRTRIKGVMKGGKGRVAAIHPSRRGERLLPWMQALAERLSGVTVLNRSWESCTSATMLGQTKTMHLNTAVLLDPPYKMETRDAAIYQSDQDGTSDDAATASYAWAVENGDRIRIAYCCIDGDFPVPDGWDRETMNLAGYSVWTGNQKTDCILFSPACLQERQESLLERKSIRQS